MPSFELTKKQREARAIICYNVFIMLFGGSRSGKTFLAVYGVIIRAIKTPKSRHVILRHRFNAVKMSILADTFPKVMEICFPEVQYNHNKADSIISFSNKSEIYFAGLDDKKRTEKILGMEFCTIYLNECSQIMWSAVGLVKTRLAQVCIQADGVPLKNRMIFDCNPPNKSHWTYKVFVLNQDPDTGETLRDKSDYANIQMNPKDNMDNLSPEYIKTLEGLPPHLRKRFLEGNFGDANPSGIFPDEDIDRWRVEDASELPDMVRVVTGVDPSGADEDDNKNNDAIGIYTACLGVDGIVYLTEDSTVKAGPATWGNVACSAYHRNKADIMVGEQNFGGAMVKFVIQTADRTVNYKIVNASRGKQQRAEPFSPMFHDGRIRVVGRQPQLEEELAGFSTFGYVGEKSPNVADAAFWCLAELFPGVVGTKKKKVVESIPIPCVSNW